MILLQGKGVVSGQGRGPALVTRMPVNFAAAFAGITSIIPGKRAVVQDRHHEFFKKNLRDTVLVFPTCTGSTFTGMVLMQVMHDREAPAAMIVQDADSLMISGTILAEIWFKRGIPVVEYMPQDLFDKIHTGDIVEVRGNTGEIKIYLPADLAAY
jgi:predicted aconitase with swiveling domain